MADASERLDFEEAARIRDLIQAIRKLQARQYVDGRAADLDVLACAMEGSHACVLLLAFRDGRNLGTRAFFQIGRATSELQSLMRISYAVFCLKKKKNQHIYSHTTLQKNKHY